MTRPVSAVRAHRREGRRRVSSAVDHAAADRERVLRNDPAEAQHPRRTNARWRRLTSSGVEYVEVRCLDLNPFLPVGIDAEEIRFLDTFLLHCLLSDSPPDSSDEAREMSGNQQRVVETGRKPGVTLSARRSRSRHARLGDDADERDAPHRGPVGRRAGDTELHIASWKEQMPRLDDADRTPSARILASMRKARVPFFRFAMNQSILHKGYFVANPLQRRRSCATSNRSRSSRSTNSARIEAADSESLDEFLAHYLAPPSIGGA